MKKASLATLVSALLTIPVCADQSKPLTMEGKKALYQRVLVSPGSLLYKTPQEQGQPQTVAPFTIYYVYERKKNEQAEWVKVGQNSHGRTVGWINNENLIPWNQSLTVSFKDPRSTGRILFFRDKESIKSIINNNDIVKYDLFHNEAITGQLSANSPVTAIQPKTAIDIHKNFYLIPIKNYEEVFLKNEKARLLEVASVPLGAQNAGGDKQYRSGIVFAIDTTQSMRPYINRTREAMRKIYSTIQSAGLKDKVNFGLTAFRDHQAVPSVSYLTRNYVSLDKGNTASSFFSRANTVNPAKISNEDFAEDAYAGVKAAIENNNWDNFAARYIILITDASSREADDPLSSTHKDAEAIRQLAHDKGIAIWVFHLRTQMGADDHLRAEQQYKVLSYYPNIGDFYYGVRMGEVNEFGQVLETLAKQVTEQVKNAATKTLPQTPAASAATNELEELQGKVSKLGYALQMRYFQKSQEEKPPKVFDAWVLDRDIHNPEKATLDVRVLLTRDQLSDLKALLQRILNLAEEGVLSPSSFLAQLKALAATLSRNPDEVSQGNNLAELGYMREYIEGLPYTSEVMNISLSDWESWSAKQQFELLHRLEEKVNYYQNLHDHTDLWVATHGGPITGDAVYPILLQMLP